MIKIRRIAHSHYILSFLFIFLFTSCNPIKIPNNEIYPTETNNEQNCCISVYFSNPNNLLTWGYEGGPDVYLAETIDNARLSIDVAAYDFNLWSLRDALIHAYKRGVVVRIVMESDNMDNVEVQDLINVHIPIIGDQQEGLMHDKFMVIDREEVWTGSMNYTVGGAYRDDNNLVNVRSKWLAELYTAEFEQMFTQRLFERAKRSPSSLRQTESDISGVEALFSPEDNVANRIVELIQNAQTSIEFMLYSFTLDQVGDSLIKKYQEGVKIQGVMDSDQAHSNLGTEFDRLKDLGIDVRLDGNEDLMHNKVMIIDNSIVITGSYNFSNNAENINDENVLIIKNIQITALFKQDFDRIYNQAIP